MALFERDFGAALGAAFATTLGAAFLGSTFLAGDFVTLAAAFLEEDLAGLETAIVTLATLTGLAVDLTTTGLTGDLATDGLRTERDRVDFLAGDLDAFFAVFTGDTLTNFTGDALTSALTTDFLGETDLRGVLTGVLKTDTLVTDFLTGEALRVDFDSSTLALETDLLLTEGLTDLTSSTGTA